MLIATLWFHCGNCDAEVGNPISTRKGEPCPTCGIFKGWRYRECEPVDSERNRDRMDDQFLLGQGWRQIFGHAQSGHTGGDTLNRLLKKHSARRFGENSPSPPTLEPESIGSKLEEWDTADIAALWRGHERERPGAIIAAQFAIYLPIVVLRLGDDHWLMDGNNRVNKRMQQAVPGPHPVYLWEAASSDSSEQR